MEYIISILIGFLLGSLSPSALIAKIKHSNLRKTGTGNLGATNVMLSFGKALGALVMIFDIAKSVAAVLICNALFPEIEWIGLLSGVAAILGHVFPFYMRFRGGKGLAAFAGMVLAYNPLLFLFLLVTGVILMILVNYSFILPYYAAVAFPIHAAVTTKSIPTTLLCLAASSIIMIKHAGNVKKARNGADLRVRDVIGKMLHKANKSAQKDDIPSEKQ